MGARGKQSATDIDRIGPKGRETTKRPDPPRSLTGPQKALWKKIVSRFDVDHFPVYRQDLLAAYCRHATTHEKLSKLIDKIESARSVNVQDYNRLLQTREREVRAMASLAVRLGFAYTTKKSQTSTPFDDEKGTRQKAAGSKSSQGSVIQNPWEFDAEEAG